MIGASRLATLGIALLMIQPACAVNHDRADDEGVTSDLPVNLEECFTALEKTLTPEQKQQFVLSAEDDLIEYHFTIGLFIRNNWLHGDSSQLREYFKELGIEHPDDMSAIVLTSYWRHLHNQPLLVDEQVAGYRSYWKDVGPDD